MPADTELPMHAIIFSMVDGTVWASWPGKNVLVNLGQSDAVTYMMRDFLAQCDLGESMAVRRSAKG